MKRQKLLLDIGGKPVLRRTLEAVLASKLDEVICVVRDLKPLRRQVALINSRLRWIVNQEADGGKSASVAAGLRAVDGRSEAALFLVGDQPLIAVELIDALLDRFINSPAWIVAPTFQGQTRNPILFRRDLFPEMLELTGDRGGRDLIDKYREKSALLEWSDETPFLDVDVWEDYEKLKSAWAEV